MNVNGEMVIGLKVVKGAGEELFAFDPALNVPIEPGFATANPLMVNDACELASNAFDEYRQLPLTQRALFLEQIAENILNLGGVLIERVQAETGLAKARIEGERSRTVAQLRLFASAIRDGGWIGVTVDSALPERQPTSRPDLRMQKIPIGPVLVFGASNFPLAFSVAGGDTASALAAGCPVIVKAHSAHLGTSELVAKAVMQASITCGIPEGVFSLIIGKGSETGQILAENPAVKAVAFTGSRQAGLALANAIAKRGKPIPLFAEMSSVNPFFILPSALAARGSDIAKGLADSVTMGMGQFCTNPGLIVMIETDIAHACIGELGAALADKEAQPMLTPGIANAYRTSVARRREATSVRVYENVNQGSVACIGRPVLFSVNAADFLKGEELSEEIFGPSTLVVLCRDEEEMVAVAEHVDGQLTCTMQLDPNDLPLARKLLPTLERKAGRVLVNGYPTGVEVTHAMVHGGPYPATSDSRTTSVGVGAMERFLRPICYQNFPAELLPPAVQHDNPLKLRRLVDGQMNII